MDYKRVLRLHFVNHLSGREIAESCGDCSKTTVNEFLKRFRENPELSYPLPADVTNEYIEGLLYKKPGVSSSTGILQIASPNGHLCHIRRPLCGLIGGQLGTH